MIRKKHFLNKLLIVLPAFVLITQFIQISQLKKSVVLGFVPYLATDDVFYDELKYDASRFDINAILNQNDQNNHLEQTLRRHKEGQAAVVIIQVTDCFDMDGNPEPDRFLFQRKSADYPLPIFANSLCLYGGNAEAVDNDDPFQTLIRELKEELPVEIADKLMFNGIQFLNFEYHYQEPSVLKKRIGFSSDSEGTEIEEDYGFVCALYLSRISFKDLDEIFTKHSLEHDAEGNHVLFTREELLQDSGGYVFGYDYTMSRYFGENVNHFKVGVSVTDLVHDPNLGGWAKRV